MNLSTNIILDTILYFKRKTEQKKLLRSLKNTIWAIRERNSERIVKKTIMPIVQKSFFKDTNMLMTDEEALKISAAIFLAGKKAGRIDELNSFVETERG